MKKTANDKLHCVIDTPKGKNTSIEIENRTSKLVKLIKEIIGSREEPPKSQYSNS